MELLSGGDLVAEGTNEINFDLDDVAGAQVRTVSETDTGRCTGKNDIAGNELDIRRNVLDHLTKIKKHLAGGGMLALAAVDARRQRKWAISDLVDSDDARA